MPDQNGETQRTSVLVVDDDRDIVDLLALLLQGAGLAPLLATEPASALALLETNTPSAALVDLNLRPWDGFELLGDIRRRRPHLPIIVLTVRASEDDKVRALDMGADDYIVKPFGHRELLARIRAQVRRSAREAGSASVGGILTVGALQLDLDARLVSIDGESEVRLTETEFRLLEYLMRNSEGIVRTRALARHVWGYEDAATRDVVRVTIHRLRRKLGDDSDQPRFIETLPGLGLRLVRGAIAEKTSNA
jgi:DNA-binding response OmpR family regulator